MASSSPFFIGFEDLPDDGCLLIPGRLPHPELLALSSRLKTRPVTWLIEEGAMVEPATQEYLAGEDVLAATFSRDDDPAAVGGALRQKIENNALLIFIPGDAAARPGTACHIPPDQLAFLCALSLLSLIHI